ncbi:TolC family protein [Yeosuana sp. MJ-SS3]|uniref:TolC family protein n=1 Tax=Gilvirhabdus luticola TaxID=3079858 RepID=A0ABU3U4U1_9FLAO|nr:TolC family protein [Yeosuana sp. MJ-SS3]MDU8885422.1 TolC family protein [Yeosuana sp. MJ-SS3]
MRKFLSTIILLLFSFQSFSQSKVYDIGFLVDTTNPGLESMLDELEDEIKAIVGEDAEIKFSKKNRLTNNFDYDLALKRYNELLENETDIIIAFGAVNNVIISGLEKYDKPTILFGTIGEDLIDQPPFNSLEKIENFTSIATVQSYKEDLAVLKEITSAKRIGVMVENSFLQTSDLENSFADFSDELNLELDILPFNTLEELLSKVDGYDAIYLVGVFYFTDDQIKTLADELIKKKIASFTTTPLIDVENGLLATNHDATEISQFFRRIALNVEAIVLDNEFSKTSSVIDLKRNLTINYNTARKLDIPLKYSLIATTNIIGNTTEIIAEKKYNLVDVMQEVINENLKLKTTAQDTLLSSQDLKLAKSNYLPDIYASATGAYVDPKLAEVANGQSPEVSTFGNITLSQTVFSEAANANISIQRSLQQAQKENYNSEALNTVFNASTAYFNALMLKSNYLIQSKNLELTKRNLQIATHNYEAGQSGKSDVLRFRSEASQNTQTMIEALNRLKQGFNVLNELLNNPIDTKIDVEEAELKEGLFSNYNYKQLGSFLDDPRLRKPFIDFLVQEAVTNAPELKLLDYNLKAAQRSERLYGSGRFLPTIALQGQYNYEFSRSGAGIEYPTIFPTPPDGYYNVGLNVTLPIFNQNKQNINKQIASIQSDQLNTSIDNLKLSIQRNMNDAVLQLINQIANIELSKIFEETAEEALDLTQTSYANGAVNIVQLLDAQNNYIQAQLASSNATYNYLLSSMELERALGTFFLLQTEEERQEFITRFLEYSNNN